MLRFEFPKPRSKMITILSIYLDILKYRRNISTSPENKVFRPMFLSHFSPGCSPPSLAHSFVDQGPSNFQKGTSNGGNRKDSNANTTMTRHYSFFPSSTTRESRPHLETSSHNGFVVERPRPHRSCSCEVSSWEFLSLSLAISFVAGFSHLRIRWPGLLQNLAIIIIISCRRPQERQRRRRLLYIFMPAFLLNPFSFFYSIKYL